MNATRVGGNGTSLDARPTVGTAAAARAFAEDVSTLVRAEVDLAKTEVLAGVRPKALGGGMLAAAGAIAGVAVLGLLLAAGFVLSEVAGLPGWASALIVSGVLLLVAGVLAAVGRSKLKTAVQLDVTKHNVQEDLAWAKDRLKTS